MTPAPLRLATRGSPLALWQARHVAQLLAPRPTELVVLQSQGDRDPQASLSVLGGQGIFTKAIQAAVLDGRADIAVHSLKDLPTAPTPGLCLAAVPPRGPVEDAWVSPRYPRFADLPSGATVATGSPRRRALLLHHRPDLRLIDLRGNVDTRLRRLEEQGWDGLLLAAAGLERLDRAAVIAERLDPAQWLPAVGQGALAIECRADDQATRAAVQELDHPPTHHAVLAERALLRGLGGGCLLPIAAHAREHQGELTLIGAVYSADGRSTVRHTHSGPAQQAEALGLTLAQILRERGADELLATLQRGHTAADR